MSKRIMKIIKTARYLHDRGPSIDDQPNFKNRDVDGQSSLYGDNTIPESTDAIIEKWDNKEKSNKKEKKNMTRIPKNSL